MSDRIAIIREGTDRAGRPSRSPLREAVHAVRRRLSGQEQFRPWQGSSISGNKFAYEAGSESFLQQHDGGSIETGQVVLVSLRPEKIRISPAPDLASENSLTGRIRDFSYLGSNYHFLIITDGLEMTVTAPAWKCSVQPITGKQVWLSWDSDASVLVIDD